MRNLSHLLKGVRYDYIMSYPPGCIPPKCLVCFWLALEKPHCNSWSLSFLTKEEKSIPSSDLSNLTLKDTLQFLSFLSRLSIIDLWSLSGSECFMSSDIAALIKFLVSLSVVLSIRWSPSGTTFCKSIFNGSLEIKPTLLECICVT